MISGFVVDACPTEIVTGLIREIQHWEISSVFLKKKNGLFTDNGENNVHLFIKIDFPGSHSTAEDNSRKQKKGPSAFLMSKECMTAHCLRRYEIP